jgi:hypothetical protein
MPEQAASRQSRLPAGSVIREGVRKAKGVGRGYVAGHAETILCLQDAVQAEPLPGAMTGPHRQKGTPRSDAFRSEQPRPLFQ